MNIVKYVINKVRSKKHACLKNKEMHLDGETIKMRLLVI